MANFLTKLREWSWREPRVRQAAKTTVAACLAYLIANFCGMPQAFWAAVVAIFVTQANIGASLGQALSWLWGSLIGVVVGGAVALLAGDVLSLRLAGLAVTVLARAAASPLPASAIVELRGGLEKLRDEVLTFGDRLRLRGVRATGLASDLSAIAAALTKLTDATERFRSGQNLRALPMDDVIRLLTFDFGLSQLRENIADLTIRTALLDHLVGIAGPRDSEPQ